MAIDGRYFSVGGGEFFITTFQWWTNPDKSWDKIVFPDVNEDLISSPGWEIVDPTDYTITIESLYQDGTSNFGQIFTNSTTITFREDTSSFDDGFYYGLIKAENDDNGRVTDLLQFTVKVEDITIPFNETLALELLALPTEFRPDTVAFAKERTNNAALRMLDPAVVSWSRDNGWGSRITTACEDLMRWVLAEIIYPWDSDRNKECLQAALSVLGNIKIDTDDDGIPDTGAEFGQIDLIRTG